jgi:hypothetical protein
MITAIVQGLKRALETAEQEVKQLHDAIAALDGSHGYTRGRRSTRRHMSASARRRISLAQRRRWAKIRGKRR